MSNCNGSINCSSYSFHFFKTNMLSNYLFLFILFATVFNSYFPAWANMGSWQENESLRDGQTRIWNSVEAKQVRDPITGIFSQRTIIHQYIEKADGLNYNAGTKTKPQWLPSVETIAPTDDPYFPYEAKQGPYRIRFGASINQNTPIEYSIGNDTIRLGLKYLAYYDKTNNILKPLFTTLNHVNPTVEGNKVTYKEVAPGIDVEYIYQKGVFQQNIMIGSKITWELLYPMESIQIMLTW